MEILGMCVAKCPTSDELQNQTERARNAEEALAALTARHSQIDHDTEVEEKARELLAQRMKDKATAETLWTQKAADLRPLVVKAQAESPWGPGLVKAGGVTAAIGAAVAFVPGLPFKIAGGVLIAGGGWMAVRGSTIIQLKEGQKLSGPEAEAILDSIKPDDLLIDQIEPAQAWLENLKSGIFSTGKVGDKPLTFSEVEGEAKDLINDKIKKVGDRLKIKH